MHRRQRNASPQGQPTEERGSNSNPSVKERIVTQGVGEEGCRLPSPSGINTWSPPLQALAVGLYFVALGTATVGVGRLLETVFGPETSPYPPLILGALYTLLGSTHFSVAEDFENIMPPTGTWGIRYVPGSKAFHVAWTGVSEMIFGAGMAAGALARIFGIGNSSTSRMVLDFGDWTLESACGFALFWLTVGVTPANVFMLTHGARLPKNSPGGLPLAFHGVRLFIQSLLLALLYRIGHQTFRAWI